MGGSGSNESPRFHSSVKHGSLGRLNTGGPGRVEPDLSQPVGPSQEAQREEQAALLEGEGKRIINDVRNLEERRNERIRITEEREGVFREKYGDDLADYALAYRRREFPVGFRMERNSRIEFRGKKLTRKEIIHGFAIALNAKWEEQSVENRATFIEEFHTDLDTIPRRILKPL